MTKKMDAMVTSLQRRVADLEEKLATSQKTMALVGPTFRVEINHRERLAIMLALQDRIARWRKYPSMPEGAQQEIDDASSVLSKLDKVQEEAQTQQQRKPLFADIDRSAFEDVTDEDIIEYLKNDK